MGLMERTQARAQEHKDEYRAEVRLHMADGSIRRASATTRLGRGGDNALSDFELCAKFVDCAGYVMDTATAASLFSALLDLDQVADIRDLTSLLRDRKSTRL